MLTDIPSFWPINMLDPSEVTGLPLSPISEFALQLVVWAKDEAFVSGTAVVIAPGLLWTAKHVFLDYWKRYESETLPTLGAAEVIHLFALQFLNQHQANIWRVTKVWASAHTDAIVLKLEAFGGEANSHNWRVPTFSALPPSIGSVIRGFGYWPGDFGGKILDNQVTINLNIRTYATVGVVQEVHHEKRDSVNLPFPCFRTNAQFEGGMSGGPIFNTEGNICGLICLSTDDCTTYVSSIWPVLTTLIDVPHPGMATGSRYPLYDLAFAGVMQVADMGALRVERDETGAVQRIGIRIPD